MTSSPSIPKKKPPSSAASATFFAFRMVSLLHSNFGVVVCFLALVCFSNTASATLPLGLAICTPALWASLSSCSPSSWSRTRTRASQHTSATLALLSAALCVAVRSVPPYLLRIYDSTVTLLFMSRFTSA